jgi:hypothetical protein
LSFVLFRKLVWEDLNTDFITVGGKVKEMANYRTARGSAGCRKRLVNRKLIRLDKQSH